VLYCMFVCTETANNTRSWNSLLSIFEKLSLTINHLFRLVPINIRKHSILMLYISNRLPLNHHFLNWHVHRTRLEQNGLLAHTVKRVLKNIWWFSRDHPTAYTTLPQLDPTNYSTPRMHTLQEFGYKYDKFTDLNVSVNSSAIFGHKNNNNYNNIVRYTLCTDIHNILRK